jgi:two-component system, OmpR family, alkaline phosphatase synthesis response regulator PhoP
MSKKILFIEDFPVIQSLYGDFLKSRDFDVDIASDGQVALDKVKDNTYDFVLVDLLLPNLNGIQFLEKFSDRPAQTKVIVLSDFNEEKTYEQAQKLGIAAYLIKAENTPSELLAKLESLSQEPVES